ncbi:hypothetical protein niasHS_006145 [Heterodera schachtii]|uniref:ubiquitinyl hydrolase 1 n=1 Tax=Heterodera schachtii TaxID=97005 RepID=A0ABD2JW21_HETSC
MYFTISDYTGINFPLMNAATGGHLENNENVDSLMKPPSWGHLAVGVNFLLENDANFLHVDMDDFNALLWAVNNRRTEVARHFVAIELGTNQRNTAGFWMSFNFGSGGSHPHRRAHSLPSRFTAKCTTTTTSSSNTTAHIIMAGKMPPNPAAAVPTHYRRRAAQSNAASAAPTKSASPLNVVSSAGNFFLSGNSEFLLDNNNSKTKIVAFANFGQCTSSSAAASSPVPFHHRKQAKDTHQQPAQPLDDDGTGNFFLSAYAMSAEVIASDSEWKKTPLGQTGLFNLGNTCFMNATLQPLFHTPGFSQLFREKSAQRFVNGNNSFGTNGMISGSFSALIDLIWSGKFGALRPTLFLEFFARRVNAVMADRQQHDAQEFQLYLLDALHEDTNRVDKRQPFEQNYDDTDLGASASDFNERSKLFCSSPVNELFNLTTISVIKCSTCNTTSVRFEAVNQISLELPTNIDGLKLKDCLEAHFSSASLEDKWNCPKCKSKQPATRSTKIWEVPKLLIVHLKRFSPHDGHYVKNVEVTFDVAELDLAPFLQEKSPHPNAPPQSLRHNGGITASKRASLLYYTRMNSWRHAEGTDGQKNAQQQQQQQM